MQPRRPPVWWDNEMGFETPFSIEHTCVFYAARSQRGCFLHILINFMHRRVPSTHQTMTTMTDVAIGLSAYILGSCSGQRQHSRPAMHAHAVEPGSHLHAWVLWVMLLDSLLLRSAS